MLMANRDLTEKHIKKVLLPYYKYAMGGHTAGFKDMGMQAYIMLSVQMQYSQWNIIMVGVALVRQLF